MRHPVGAQRVVVGITGASGAILGVRTLQALRMLGVETHVVVSKWAERTLRTEMGSDVDLRALASYTYGVDNMAARVSSGSFRTAGMAIVPCSMNTVSAIAHGLTNNLIQRAADVTLKERRRLVVMPRETPLSLVHLRNLTMLAEAGATVMPPVPGFYNRPTGVEEIVRHLVARLLDQMDIDNDLTHRWGEPRNDALEAEWASVIKSSGVAPSGPPHHLNEGDQ